MGQTRVVDIPQAPFWLRAQLIWAVGLTAVFVVVQALPATEFFSEQGSYAILHLALEFFAMAISLMVFALAWNLRTSPVNSQIMTIGVFSLAVVLIDLAHTLSYAGMPNLVTQSGPEKAINFWLAGQLLTSIGLLVVAVVPARHWSSRSWYSGVAVTVLLAGVVWWVGMFHPEWLPRTFVEGRGLTQIKVVSEYALSAVFFLATILLLLRARRERSTEIAWLTAAAWTLVLAELFFTVYVSVTDSFNLVGHVFKVIAALMVYRAVFAAGVQRPRQQLATESALLRSLVDAIPDLISFTDSDGRYRGVNRAFTARTGIEESEVLGQSPDALVADDPALVHRTREDTMSENGATRRFEEWIPDRTGAAALFDTVRTPYFGGQGERLGIIEVSRDVTAQRQAEQRIEELALFDQLTELPNRFRFLQELHDALAGAESSGTPHAVVYVDLDDFKTINDTLGHRVGDVILTETARRLQRVVGPDDLVARMGGDEFSVLLCGAGPVEAGRFAERLIEAIDDPFVLDDYELSITPSVGIALYPSDGVDVEELTRCADAAMYQAKRDGRDTFRFFTDEVRDQTARRLRLLTALRRAVPDGELRLHYQPQVDLRTRETVGVEALVRWQHPELGLLGPREFIDLAEDSGIILAIGDWVLRTAIADVLAWDAAGLPPLTLAVNLSAVQFMQADLPEEIAAILASTGFPPRRLEIELTETVAMRNPEAAAATIEELHASGLRIAIDDFGTGYSSMAYLKRFRIDRLKIDQSFVFGLGITPGDEAIVDAVIKLGHALHFEVIAEGVESETQRDFLISHGCDHMQGFHACRPLPSDDLIAFLQPVRETT